MPPNGWQKRRNGLRKMQPDTRIGAEGISAQSDEKGQIIALSGLSLDPVFNLVRDLPKKIAHLAGAPEISDFYDYYTLAYAAIGLSEKNMVRLYCPRTFNLERLIRDGRFSTSTGDLAIASHKKYSRFEFIDLKAGPKGFGSTLEFSSADFSLRQHIFKADTDRFKNKNVLYTMQRDNDLDWVADWVRYHASAHGANGVVIADNGSTRYSAHELLATLAGVKGIEKACVVTVPYKYGPGKKYSSLSKSRFLQMAIQNAVKELLLTSARAVVSQDIDELVISRSGRSVFDAVASSRFGAFTIPGFWRVCDPSDGRPEHSKSVFIYDRRTQSCQPKYAVVPKSRLGQTPWATHSLYYLPRKLLMSREFWYAHCRDVTTNWLGDRPLNPLPKTAERDAELEHILKVHLAPQ